MKVVKCISHHSMRNETRIVGAMPVQTYIILTCSHNTGMCSCEIESGFLKQISAVECGFDVGR